MPVTRLSQNRRRRSSQAVLVKAGTYAPRPYQFAPNVSPETFVQGDGDPNDPASLSALALAQDDSLGVPYTSVFPPTEMSAILNAKPTRKRLPPGKRPSQGYIPRPPNAFMLFRSFFVKSGHVPTGIENNHGSLSKIIGNTWRLLPLQEKNHWEAEAKKAKAAHKEMYPDYRFRPVHKKKAEKERERAALAAKKARSGHGALVASSSSSSSASNSRSASGAHGVMSAQLDEERSEIIADLLLKGYKGDKLQEAVRQLDKELEERLQRQQHQQQQQQPEFSPDYTSNEYPHEYQDFQDYEFGQQDTSAGTGSASGGPSAYATPSPSSGAAYLPSLPVNPFSTVPLSLSGNQYQQQQQQLASPQPTYPTHPSANGLLLRRPSSVPLPMPMDMGMGMWIDGPVDGGQNAEMYPTYSSFGMGMGGMGAGRMSFSALGRMSFSGMAGGGAFSGAGPMLYENNLSRPPSPSPLGVGVTGISFAAQQAQAASYTNAASSSSSSNATLTTPTQTLTTPTQNLTTPTAHSHIHPSQTQRTSFGHRRASSAQPLGAYAYGAYEGQRKSWTASVYGYGSVMPFMHDLGLGLGGFGMPSTAAEHGSSEDVKEEGDAPREVVEEGEGDGETAGEPDFSLFNNFSFGGAKHGGPPPPVSAGPPSVEDIERAAAAASVPNHNHNHDHEREEVKEEEESGGKKRTLQLSMEALNGWSSGGGQEDEGLASAASVASSGGPETPMFFQQHQHQHQHAPSYASQVHQVQHGQVQHGQYAVGQQQQVQQMYAHTHVNNVQHAQHRATRSMDLMISPFDMPVSLAGSPAPPAPAPLGPRDVPPTTVMKAVEVEVGVGGVTESSFGLDVGYEGYAYPGEYQHHQHHQHQEHQAQAQQYAHQHAYHQHPQHHQRQMGQVGQGGGEMGMEGMEEYVNVGAL